MALMPASRRSQTNRSAGWLFIRTDFLAGINTTANAMFENIPRKGDNPAGNNLYGVFMDAKYGNITDRTLQDHPSGVRHRHDSFTFDCDIEVYSLHGFSA